MNTRDPSTVGSMMLRSSRILNSNDSKEAQKAKDETPIKQVDSKKPKNHIEDHNHE